MKLTLIVENSRVADLMINAIESGLPRYWCAGVDLKRSSVPKLEGGNWYENPDLYVDEKLRLVVRELVETGRGASVKNHVLTADSFRKGMEVMATKYGKHFGRFLAEDDDAETADVFLQCCTFGEIIYG